LESQGARLASLRIAAANNGPYAAAEARKTTGKTSGNHGGTHGETMDFPIEI
jgi:hypothetical protein